MSKKLFVGGLAWATSDEGLAAAFSSFGTVVEAKVITDRETGRSRGFGFVTFADEASASQAVEGMNGRQLDGRTLRVDLANEQQKPPREGGDFGGGRDRGDRGDRRGPRRY